MNSLGGCGRGPAFLMVSVIFDFHCKVPDSQVHYLALAESFNDGCLDDSVTGMKIIAVIV